MLLLEDGYLYLIDFLLKFIYENKSHRYKYILTMNLYVFYYRRRRKDNRMQNILFHFNL